MRFALYAVVALLPGVLGVGAGDGWAGDRFLTLPYAAASSMNWQQSWTYDDGTAHKGVDFIKGTPDRSSTWTGFTVLAAAKGIVHKVNTTASASSWGKYVIVRHRKADFSPALSDDYFTVYAHLEQVYAPKEGTVIERGGRVGFAGKTGAANNLLHLHWECHKGSVGNKIDPLGIYQKRDYYPGWRWYRTDARLRRTEDTNTCFTTVPPKTSQ